MVVAALCWNLYSRKCSVY